MDSPPMSSTDSMRGPGNDQPVREKTRPATEPRIRGLVTVWRTWSATARPGERRTARRRPAVVRRRTSRAVAASIAAT